MEYIVTLHAQGGSVITRYPPSMQATAIALWQAYVNEGKAATLSVQHEEQNQC